MCSMLTLFLNQDCEPNSILYRQKIIRLADTVSPFLHDVPDFTLFLRFEEQECQDRQYYL